MAGGDDGSTLFGVFDETEDELNDETAVEVMVDEPRVDGTLLLLILDDEIRSTSNSSNSA